jgi:hypothetical protein
MFGNSLFQTIVRANDGSLWAMGVAEYDKNTIPNPISVLRPIPPDLNKSLSSNEAPIDDRVFDVPADSTGATLHKGNNRVSIMYGPGKSPYNNYDPNRGDYYDVVVHNGEAYYLPMAFDCPVVPTEPSTRNINNDKDNSSENRFVNGMVGGFKPKDEANGNSSKDNTKDVEIIDYCCAHNHTVFLTKP